MPKKIAFILLAICLIGFFVSYIIVLKNFKPINLPTQKYIQTKFTREEVLMFSEHGFSKKKLGTECLLKFEKPSITFKVLGRPSPDQLQFLLKQVDTINQMLHHNKLCYMPDSRANTHITYYFWTDLECKQFLPKYYQGSRDGLILPLYFTETELHQLVIILSTFPRTTEKIKSSIFNETLKALGLFNRLAYENEALPSDTLFSTTDLACIKMMYNSGLKSGTYLSHFKSVFNITEDEIWETLYQPKKQTRKLLD